MTTTPDLPALACEDCPAVVHHSRNRGMFGAVPVVAVEHSPSCPWLAAHVPQGGVTIVRAEGILMHSAALPEECP